MIAYASYFLSLRQTFVAFRRIAFPAEMVRLNDCFVYGLFVVMGRDDQDLTSVDPVFGNINPIQRDISQLRTTLISKGNNLNFERVPLAYFTNSGFLGVGNVGAGNRPARIMQWPEINQKIVWDASFFDVLPPNITEPSTLQLFVKYEA